jgi:TPR repeat protein
MKLKILAFIAIAAMSVSGPANADSYWDAYDRGDYQTAFKLISPTAKDGADAAQTLLANLYYEGKGTPQSYENAAKWFKLAAAQGVPAPTCGGVLQHPRAMKMRLKVETKFKV